MNRPRVLDLFCKAGGAGMGYHQAGFNVVGVDIEPQRNYPFELVQADALEFDVSGFDLLHASPPCQKFSTMTKRHLGRSENHPDLIDPIRKIFKRSGTPYIIENVVGAPLIDPVVLCGSMFDLKVRRHRCFEISGFSANPPL